MSSQYQRGQDQSFETVNNRRIQKMQNQLSLRCSEYDGLMPMLSMKYLLNSASSFEKQINSFRRQLNFLNQSITQKDQKSAAFDRNFWQQQLLSIQMIIQQNNETIQQMYTSCLQKSSHQSSFKTSEQFQEITNEFKTFCHGHLAQFKNSIELQLNSRNHDRIDQERLEIERQLQSKLQPINQQLLYLQGELEIQNCLLQPRNLKKFHDFNYNRLKYQLIDINKSFSVLLDRFSSKQGTSENQKSQIRKRKSQIDQIESQIRGSCKKLLSQISFTYFEKTDKYEVKNLEEQIQNDMQDLYQNLKQVKTKYQQLISLYN